MTGDRTIGPMTDRADLARQILSADPIDGFAPKVNDGAIFAGRYPGGFAPVSKFSEGGFLEFCPTHIVTIGADLSDAQFRRMCDAIHSYQRQSIVATAMQYPPDLIVLTFIDDEPEDATVLAVMAQRWRMSFVRFLGADRGTGVQT